MKLGFSFLIPLLLVLWFPLVKSFVLQTRFLPGKNGFKNSNIPLERLSATPDTFTEKAVLMKKEVQAMRAGAIKKELEERFRVGTSGIFEKEELVQALVEARLAQGDSAGASASSSTSSPLVDIPAGAVKVPIRRFRPREGVLGANVKVDEKDYFAITLNFPNLKGGYRADFLIDTAATNSLLSARAQANIQAPPTGRSATASAGTATVGGLFQVDLGEAVLAGKPCGTISPVVMELPVPDTVSGILGLDFLQRYDMAIDFGTDEAIFAPPNSAMKGELGASAMEKISGRFLYPVPMFVVDVQLSYEGNSPVSVPAVVDMGSAFTIMNWKASAAAGAPKNTRGLKDTGQVISGASAPGQMYQPIPVNEGYFNLRLGSNGQAIHNKCCIGDIPAFGSLGLQQAPAMIIGLDCLCYKNGKIVLSLQNQALWV
mmetsp:Transcript_38/g.49  ORF Transcript_38/g.49 Transcript_38/m.49 type:complete len:430 (+) Transcript_38:145-1434(+)